MPQQEADAIVSVRDPEGWLEDSLLWFAEAGDALKCQALLQVLQQLRDERDSLVSDLVQAVSDQAAADLISQAGS